MWYDNVNFISNLGIGDFPYERIEGCISALKYLSKKSGLTFNINKNNHYKQVEVLLESTHIDPISNEKKIIKNKLVNFIVDDNKQQILFPIEN
jgi:hypothetical protein